MNTFQCLSQDPLEFRYCPKVQPYLDFPDIKLELEENYKKSLSRKKKEVNDGFDKNKNYDRHIIILITYLLQIKLKNK